MEVELISTFYLLLCVVMEIMICPCESTFTLTSDQNTDGGWTFKDGDSVTLKCTISPYTNTLKWKYASSEVSTCSISSCQQILTGNGAFSFGSDITNGIFYWTVNPVTKEHNDKLFECHDGTNTLNFKAKVKTKESDITGRIAIAGLVTACVAVTIVIILVCVCFCNKTPVVKNGFDKVAEQMTSRLEAKIEQVRDEVQYMVGDVAKRMANRLEPLEKKNEQRPKVAMREAVALSEYQFEDVSSRIEKRLEATCKRAAMKEAKRILENDLARLVAQHLEGMQTGENSHSERPQDLDVDLGQDSVKTSQVLSPVETNEVVSLA